MNTTTCEVCGDAIELHIGHKPCVQGRDRSEIREQHRREYPAKQLRRLFGPDAH